MTKNDSSQNKDVIYIDVDDEITGIIDKLQQSTGKIVALVLPKRAAVLQSIVNLKLLKRTADDSKKNLVLITSESSLLPLAGAVGIHVAKTLQSKPVVPAAPTPFESTVEVAEAGATLDEPLEADAAAAPLAAQAADEETIEVGDDEEPPVESSKPNKQKKPKKDKKLLVPNFNTFRTRVILGVIAVILLILAWFIGFRVLPKAQIIVKTDNTTVASNLTLTASPAAEELDKENMIVPAVSKQLKKTDSLKVPTTGQKDAGTKASGSVTLSLTNCAKEQVTVPAGTAVSGGGLNFITQLDVTLQSVKIGTTCRNSDFKEVSTAKVKVVAQNAGDQYNLSPRSYTVAGHSNVSGAGEAMTGGTSKIIKVVSQQDLDTAKQKVIEAANTSATQEITDSLKGEGMVPITETLSTGEPVVIATPNVGDEAEEVAVNVTITFEMTGAKKDALKELLEEDIKKKIDTSSQNILDNGLDEAIIHAVDNKKRNGEVKITLQASAQAGVQQNEDEIKQAVAGMKRGEVQDYILSRPGVKDVEVKYSPMWVTKTPKSTSKITVVFEQANDSTSSE